MNIVFASVPHTMNNVSSRRLTIPAISMFLLVTLLALCALMFYSTVVFAVDNGESVIMTAPSEPIVPPDIPIFDEMDTDGNKLDDQIDFHLNDVRNVLSSRIDSVTESSLQAQLMVLTPVEFVFSSQITQKQIDDFLALGGTIDHIYQAVSYGWNGSLPLGLIEKFRDSMGDSLVGIVDERQTWAHMDEAGRTGRVRPVWVPGFAGNPSGFSGSATTTIAIIDTGIDDSHADLTGRLEYWKDWTFSKLASPADNNGHGSHVTGIAVGTGAASGIAGGTLYYTDYEDLTGIASGSFYPSPIHIYPSTSSTLSSTATWIGGGSTSLYGLLATDGSTSWGGLSAAIVGSLPLSEVNSFTPLSSYRYSAGLSQATLANITSYVVANSVTNYPAVGDSFNKLSGVAPGCRWAGLRALDNTGSGTSTDINEAIDDIVTQRITHNIKVANMSIGLSGTPGLSPAMRAKVNTAVNNGIVLVISAGNDGPGTAGANLVDDPGRAALAITVGASNDINQLTRYTSSGFTSPGADEDIKPDLLAPGGSSYYSGILSVDSNDGDGELVFTDKQANDYLNIMGTSMASPFVAGSAALVIQALENQGLSWNFGNSTHPLLVKMLLCATSTETNALREVSSGTNPTLGRAAAPKDLYEGYGILNADAAVEAVSLFYTGGSLSDGTAGGYFNRRAWARKVVLIAGGNVTLNLSVPGTGDYDLYLYSGIPDSKGNPVIRASSTNTASGTSEIINYTSVSGETVYMVIKRVSGNGNWTIAGNVINDTTLPTVTTVAVQTGLTVDVTYSEAMGAGVIMAANYTISGTGKGTLASNPASVVLVSENKYRITWTTGEMKNGGDIIITVVNVQDLVGNSIGSPNYGTDTGDGIGIIPMVTSIVRKTPLEQYYNGSSVVWTVTFSEMINAATVSIADFTLTDVSSSITVDSITNVTPSIDTATAFDVTCSTGAGNGTLRLDVLDATDTINDLAGNDITANFTTGETYIISLITANVTLEDWVAASSVTLPFQVKYRKSGTLDALTIVDMNLVITSGGGVGTASFSLVGLPLDTYDIWVKCTHWLAKMIPGINVLVNPDISNITLINGDLVERNEIDFSDINAVRAAYGSFPGDETWNAMADVDGTGEVDFTDINIVRSNYGEIGD